MMTRLVAFAAALAFSLWMQAVPTGAQQPARIAFVVGNAEYGQSPLPTALNDAGLVAEALRSVGFEVIEGANLNQVDFVLSFRKFLERAEAGGPDAVLFIYVSGYGFAFDGDNYLAAVDAKLDRESDIPLETMRLSDLIRTLEGAPARTKVVAIDAARRLPFPLAAAGLAPGLVAVEAPQTMLIGFSAAPGQLLANGAGPYGAYATATAEMVRAAGLDIAAAFTRIRARTHQLTEGQQTPWHVAALGEPAAILVPADAAAVAPAPAMPATTRARRPFREVGPEEAYAVAIERDELPGYVEFVEAYPRHPYAARIWAIIRARREALAWRRAANINSPQSYWTYLQRYPNGIYALDAERRLRRLSADFQPPPDFAPVEFVDVPPPLADEPLGIIDYVPPAPPPPVVLIEPGPAYFVDLPPPPPLTRGGLPAVTVLPVIPRVAPGVRVPVAVGRPGDRQWRGPPPREQQPCRPARRLPGHKARELMRRRRAVRPRRAARRRQPGRSRPASSPRLLRGRGPALPLRNGARCRPEWKASRRPASRRSQPRRRRALGAVLRLRRRPLRARRRRRRSRPMCRRADVGRAQSPARRRARLRVRLRARRARPPRHPGQLRRKVSRRGRRASSGGKRRLRRAARPDSRRLAPRQSQALVCRRRRPR